MAGPPSVVASSAAYATIPNAYGTALALGWIVDQRLDLGSTGGFLTNCTPSSSSTFFTSSGDGTTGASGTGLYSIGRRVRVIQGVSTGYGSVATASLAAGVTTVTLSAFTTGISTGLSTGAITSAAVGSVIRDSAVYAALGTASAFLSADTNSTSTGTAKDLVSVSLSTGTWWATAGLTWGSGNTPVQLTAKLWDGSTTIATAGDFAAATSSTAMAFGLSGIIPVPVATTWKVSVLNNLSGSSNIVIYAAVPNHSTGNNATYLIATKISAST